MCSGSLCILCGKHVHVFGYTKTAVQFLTSRAGISPRNGTAALVVVVHGSASWWSQV